MRNICLPKMLGRITIRGSVCGEAASPPQAAHNAPADFVACAAQGEVQIRSDKADGKAGASSVKLL